MLKITYKAKKTRKREKERKTGRPRERETDKSECQKEGEMGKVCDRRTQQQKEGGRKRRERGRKAAQFMPLSPCSKDSSLGGLRL